MMMMKFYIFIEKELDTIGELKTFTKYKKAKGFRASSKSSNCDVSFIKPIHMFFAKFDSRSVDNQVGKSMAGSSLPLCLF